MRTPLRRLFAGLFILWALPAFAGEWVIQFDVNQETTILSPDGKTAPRTEKRHYTETVALHENHLVADDEQWRTIFDFKHGQLIRLNLAHQTYTRGSIYPVAAFFEHELSNRNHLGGALRAAKLSPEPVYFDRFWNETVMHMESAQAPADMPVPKIEATQAGTAQEFRYAGQLVARFTPGSAKLTPVLQHRFVNYLAYQCALHPQIRQALAETGAPPQELTFHVTDTGKTSVTTLHLVSSQAADTDSSVLPADAKPEPIDPQNPLAAVLAACDAVAAKPARPTLAEAVKFADAAIAGGRNLDAVLALLEYGLVSGDQPIEAVKERRAAFTDPVCQTYFKAFDQSSKEAAERSLHANDSLDRKNLTKAYMLDVQRANLLEAVGRQNEAVPLFLSVLRANPYHTGALHDLGMIYARGYDEYLAWRCWTTARALYPHHPMLRDIDDFERKLVVRQLDFF